MNKIDKILVVVLTGVLAIPAFLSAEGLEDDLVLVDQPSAAVTTFKGKGGGLPYVGQVIPNQGLIPNPGVIPNQGVIPTQTQFPIPVSKGQVPTQFPTQFPTVQVPTQYPTQYPTQFPSPSPKVYPYQTATPPPIYTYAPQTSAPSAPVSWSVGVNTGNGWLSVGNNRYSNYNSYSPYSPYYPYYSTTNSSRYYAYNQNSYNQYYYQRNYPQYYNNNRYNNPQTNPWSWYHKDYRKDFIRRAKRRVDSVRSQLKRIYSRYYKKSAPRRYYEQARDQGKRLYDRAKNGDYYASQQLEQWISHWESQLGMGNRGFTYAQAW